MRKEKVKRLRLPMALALVAVGGAACEKAPVDPADASPPTVEIKVKSGNEYVPATTADFSSGQVDLVAIVDDPQGVRSIDVKFLGRTSDSCTVGSSVWGGSFPIELPEDMHQDTTADDEGKVITRLPAFALIDRPECTKFGTNEKGVPYGHDITIRATGTNWGDDASTNVATTDMVVSVQ